MDATVNDLIGQPGQLRTPRMGVGMPNTLPHMSFGPLNPAQTTGSAFSGAGAPGGSMNLVHPPAPQTFQAPSFGNTGGSMQPAHIAPLIAMLMGATGVGAPAQSGTLTPRAAAPASSGYGTGAGSPFSGGGVAGSGAASAALPGGGGGYVHPAGLQAPVSQGGLITALAQRSSPYGSNFIKAY